MPFVSESPAVSGFQIGGFTRNVSRGGALLHASQSVAAGTSLNIFLHLGGRVARATGDVVWSDEYAPGNMGVRFTELNREDRLAWEQFLAMEEDHSLRSTVRVPVGFSPAYVLVSDGSLPAQIKNISDNGLMLSTTRNFAPGTRLSVGIPSWRDLPRVDIETEVRWVLDASNGAPAIHGLRLLDDDMGNELFVTGVFLRGLLEQEGESPLRGLHLLAIMARVVSGSTAMAAVQTS